MVEVDDIKQYFPELEPGDLPERHYLMSVLSTVKKDELKELIEQAREHRSISNKQDVDMMVEMTQAARDQIFNVLPQKSKLIHVS